jgi:hypothetical protein
MSADILTFQAGDVVTYVPGEATNEIIGGPLAEGRYTVAEVVGYVAVLTNHEGRTIALVDTAWIRPVEPEVAPEPEVGASEKVLRKIRGLLDQAESTPFPEEAEAFTAKARGVLS